MCPDRASCEESVPPVGEHMVIHPLFRLVVIVERARHVFELGFRHPRCNKRRPRGVTAAHPVEGDVVASCFELQFAPSNHDTGLRFPITGMLAVRRYIERFLAQRLDVTADHPEIDPLVVLVLGLVECPKGILRLVLKVAIIIMRQLSSSCSSYCQRDPYV